MRLPERNTDLARLLFGEPARDGGFFRTHVELADAILQSSADFALRKPQTLRAFLSQVVGGKRPAPHALRRAITAAIEAQPRFREISNAERESVFRKLNEAFELGAVDLTAPLDDRDEFLRMLADAKEAKVHFIQTITPAELMTKESNRAKRLTFELVDRLGLLDPDSADPDAKSIFILPFKETADKFWYHLRKCLEDDMGVSNAIACLNSASEMDRLIVNVPRKTPLLCIPPMVVYDPQKHTGFSGYVLDYHGENSVSVAKLSWETLLKWKEHVYRRWADEALDVDRVPFSSNNEG